MNMRRGLRVLLLALWPAVVASGQEGAHAPLHYRLSQQGSVLRWELPATAHTVRGTVGSFHGTIDAEPAAEGSWSIRGRVVVAADSMTTDNGRRDRKMREILETSKYPEIVFETRQVTVDLSRFRPGEQLTAQVSGDLTVHGKSVQVQLPVDVYVFKDHAVISGSFPLHWKQFGLRDPSFGVIRVREPMIVAFRLRAVPAS
jgi:polyisoprenoid-binding protein YceI